MKNDLVVKRAKEVIYSLDLVPYITNFKSINKYSYSEDEVKKEILFLADTDYEQNYLFVGKVIKQIKLLLI